MENWGGLNNALTSFRNGLMRRFPGKDTRTDGARADKAHSAISEHQEDPDGSVDAYDCDINWLASSDPDGNTIEDRITEAVKADFMADRRSRLWIHNRQISNKNVQNGKVRPYSGKSPHTEHTHFETIQRLEDDGSPWAMPRTDALLRELRGEDERVTPEDIQKIADAVWAKKLDVNIDPKGKPNLQPAGGILRYLSPEGKQARQMLQNLGAAVTGLSAVVTGLSAVVTQIFNAVKPTK